jgi:hypothetical protein
MDLFFVNLLSATAVSFRIESVVARGFPDIGGLNRVSLWNKSLCNRIDKVGILFCNLAGALRVLVGDCDC